MCLGPSSRSRDQQITHPPSAVRLAGDETQKSGDLFPPHLGFAKFLGPSSRSRDQQITHPPSIAGDETQKSGDDPLPLPPPHHFSSGFAKYLGPSSRSRDQQITHPPYAVTLQTIAGDETQNSGERRSTQYMRREYLEGFEKLEERKRVLCQRAHDFDKEASDYVGSFLNIVCISFGMIGSRGLFVDLTCQNSLVSAGEIIVIFFIIVGLGYGVTLWKINSMTVNKEILNNDMINLRYELADYLDCPDKVALSGNDKIRVKWPANWNDRCNKIKEELSNDGFIEPHARCTHIIAVISFVVGLLVILGLCQQL